MELRPLRLFVAVAETLHFGRAAQRLGMAQPPLSRAIALLEAELGAPLFKRSSRSVRLTPAGEALLAQARLLLQQAEQLERHVRQVATGQIGRMRLGFVPWGAMRILPRALREMRQHWPGLEIRVDEQMSRSQVEALRAGQLDVGILNSDLVDTSGLCTAPIESTQLAAAVPSAWPLGQRRRVKLAALAEQPFVLFPQHWVPNFQNLFEQACRRSGFKPRVIQHVGQTFTLFNMVANEIGVGLIQDSARHIKVEGVSLVTISDMEEQFRTELSVAWSPERMSPALAALLQAIGRAAGRPVIPDGSDDAGGGR